MPFGRSGPGMRQVVEFSDRSAGRGTFVGEFGARRYNQWGLTFAAKRPSSQITLENLFVRTSSLAVLLNRHFGISNFRCLSFSEIV